MKSRNIQINGMVQGVGFRPFIYNLACELKLTGWVANNSKGLEIEIEGEEKYLNIFENKLKSAFPKNAIIEELIITNKKVSGYKDFIIRNSEEGHGVTINPPDLAVCNKCLEELFNPQNRRYNYPFISCTDCGSRYSIVNSLPYDRNNTTLSEYKICEECKSEYLNTNDRRFHAQNISCSDCGPQLQLWDNSGQNLEPEDIIKEVSNSIRKEKIISIKALGGFHLMCNLSAEGKLRRRKNRGNKPFAIMYPSIEMIEEDCEVSAVEREILTSKEAPIVLLQSKNSNKLIGAILPYTPLQYLLMKELNFPIIATSGNNIGEPICYDEREVVEVLGNIADLFLVHNLPIISPIDDSVVRVINNREMIIRRARGYSSLPITLNNEIPTIIAEGAYLKNTIALSIKNKIFISTHIGDLRTIKSIELHNKTIEKMKSIYGVNPQVIKNDKYQHHYCHVLSCMVDNGYSGSCLGIAWDGTGKGDDATIWGGEFLIINDSGYERFANLKTFPLIGSETAIKEPKRVALALLYKCFGEDVSEKDLSILKQFSDSELSTMRNMIDKDINCPQTSSVGRLFDGIASLLGLVHENTFEGEAAMVLEMAACGIKTERIYNYNICKNIIEWKDIIIDIIDDIKNGISTQEISFVFHNTLAQIIVDIAKMSGQDYIALSGGCFQNKLLSELAIEKLEKENLKPLWHQNIPPNDGGLSVGQLMADIRNNNKIQNDKEK